MAGVISTQSYVNPYQWSKQMGGKRNKKSKKKKKTYTKAQQMAKARIAAKKEATKTTKTTTSYRSRKEGLEANQQRIANKQVTGTTAQVAKDNKRYGNTVPSGSFDISKEGRDQAAINRGVVAAKKTGIPSGSNLKEGSFGISEAGKKKAAINRAEVKKSSPPKVKFKEAPKLTLKVDPIDGTEIAQTRFKSVPAGGPAGDNMSTREFREGMLPGLRDVVPGESLQNTLKRITNQDKLAAADADTTGLGIGPSTVNAFKIKSPTTYGAPSQEAVDAAAGITAGGLNIGGGEVTTDKPSGSTSRVLSDPTESGLSIQEKARRRNAIFKETGVQTYGGTRNVYGYSKSELDKLRNFSDKSGLSFGSVIGQKGTNYPGQLGISEEEIALNNAYNYRDDGLVMNSIGQFVTPEQRAIDDADAGPSVGRSIATGFNNIVDRIPIIGRRLPNLKTDYTRAEQNLLTNTTPFRSGSRTKTGAVNRRGGGARLPVAPLTPEEILSPEETAVAQTGPAYQQAQTGVDPNRLMQIQQEAYLQAYNPEYNPMFRFFNRRGVGRGAFRKAFRRRN